MSPFKSSAGRSLGKLIEGFKSSTIGQGLGSGSGSGSISATGGIISTVAQNGVNTYIHKFTRSNSPENFVVTGGTLSVEILCIGGGGGCGYDTGGGGGAGGLVHFSSLDMKEGSYNFVVGGGGPSSGSGGVLGDPGGDSTIVVPNPSNNTVTVTAAGGGGGGTWPSPGNGNPGGSGGGGGRSVNAPGGTATQPGLNSSINFGGFSQYGNNGGNSAPSYHGTGGGGGAGGVGTPGTTGQNVAGGVGRGYTISGTNYTYAHGGYGNADGGSIRPAVQYYDGSPKNADPSGSGNGANGSGVGSTYPAGDVGIIYVKYLAL